MQNDNVKLKNAALSVFLAVLTIILIYSAFWGPAKQFGDSLNPSRTVSVSAEGKVTVTPDIARISFSLVSEGSDPEKIADENNRKMNAVIAFVKSEGIDPKDIKTTQYNLSPKYSYERQTGKSYIYGYTLTQSAALKIRDFKKIGKILAALPEYEANQISSVSFDVDDPEKYLAEARSMAYERAKEKSKDIAAKSGVKLGRILNVNEYGGGVPRYYDAYGGVPEAASLKVAAPTIEPGSQEVTLQVNVVYELK